MGGRALNFCCMCNVGAGGGVDVRKIWYEVVAVSQPLGSLEESDRRAGGIREKRLGGIKPHGLPHMG